jgi:hypothetical protein
MPTSMHDLTWKYANVTVRRRDSATAYFYDKDHVIKRRLEVTRSDFKPKLTQTNQNLILQLSPRMAAPTTALWTPRGRDAHRLCNSRRATTYQQRLLRLLLQLTRRAFSPFLDRLGTFG